MTDSPRTGSRHETLIDLDDHRQMLLTSPGLLRPHGASTSRPRRGTFDSIDEGFRSQSDPNPNPDLLSGTVARDFECAIVDDNASVTGVPPMRAPSFSRAPRRVRRPSVISRDGSPSPPTSLNAFNNQHRYRSNTVNTQDSGPEFSHRRKLTFSEGKDKENDSISTRSTDTEAEQDVCYPQDDHPADGPAIDFEELEEYVAEAQQVTAPNTPAVIPLEQEIKDNAVSLPPPALGPSDDAFAELEKVKLRESSSNSTFQDRRASQVQIQRPFYTFCSPDLEDTVHATSLGGLLADGETFKDLFTANQGDAWWLDVVSPSEEEVSVLCKAFSIHPLTREDITTEESRDKVEMFSHYYFVAFRSFEDDKKDEEYLEPIHWYAIVLRYGVLTFCSHKTPHASAVRKRIAKLRDYMSMHTDWIAYAMIDDIVDSFMPVIEDVDKEVDGIEDNVYTTREENARDVLTQIGECRRKVMSLLRLLGGKSDVIKGFAKRCNPAYEIAPASDVGMYLSDIQDHIVSMRDNLSHSEQLLSRIHTNFLAQINIDNINSGNKTNKMLGKVTLIATILVPMNLVTGLFGMNVKVPFSGDDIDNTHAWFGILGFIGVFSICAIVLFRYLRLI
jgi:magnesium transporter